MTAHELLAQPLPDLLSAALRHPDMPADLYNHIGDWIISYGNQEVSAPERIRRALAAYDTPDSIRLDKETP